MTTSKIQIVEDEHTVAELMKNMLQRSGYVISSIVTSGEEAIKKVEQDQPDLVLMDIKLNGKIDGIDASQQIYSQNNIPFIFITAYVDEHLLERVKDTMPYGFIIKPFSNIELISTVKIALAKGYKDKEIKRLNNILYIIRNVSFLISREKNQQQLLQKICDIFLERGDYNYAWIMLINIENKLIAHAASGLNKTDFQKLLIQIKQGYYPSCVNKVQKQIGEIVKFDKANDCESCPLVKEYTDEKTLIYQFKVNNDTFGFLNFGIPQKTTISEAELSIFYEIADDISYSLNILDIEKKHTQALKALLESENKYKELFHNIHSGVVIYEAIDNGNDFIIKDFNRSCEKIDKIKKEDVIGKPVTKAFPGIKEFGLLKILQRVWATGKPEHYPGSFYQDKRIAGWRENYVYKLLTGEIVAVYEDITSQKKAEEALITSEQKYHDLYENAPDMFVSVDLKTAKIIECNKTTLKKLGYEKEELIGLPISAVYHPKCEKYRQQTFKQFFETGEVRNVELILQRKDDISIDVSLNMTAVRDDHGKIQYSRSSLRDITERKQLDNALQKRTYDLGERVKELNCLYSILNIIIDPLFSFSEKIQKITNLIPSGYQYPEITCSQIIIADKEYKTDTFITTKWKQAKDISAFNQPVGKLEIYYLKEMPIKDEGPFLKEERSLINAIAIKLESFIEHEKLEKKLLEISDNEQRRIGHDLHDGLGQDLTGIAFLAKSLSQKLKNKSLNKAAEAIVTQVNKAISQTRNLARGLSFVILESEGLEAALKKMAMDISNLYNISCEFEYNKTSVINNNILKMHLYRIAQEAVSNAVKHANAKNILIVLTDNHNNIILTIKDNGTGIPETTNDQQGMGLPIMKYRAKMINALLKIDQNNDGGSIITCTIKINEDENNE